MKIRILKIVSNFDIRISNLLFYLLLLLLPTQLGRHFWPPFSYVLGIRIDYLSPTLYVTDILVLCLFICWIISNIKFLISNVKFLIKQKKINFKNLIGVIKNLIGVILNLFQNLYRSKSRTKFGMTWLTVLLLGIIFSKSPLAGFYGLLKLGEFIFFGFYISQTVNKAMLSNIIIIFSLGVVFESLLAIAQFFHLGSIGGLLYFLGERTFTSQTPGIANASINGELILRPYGTFPHPNVLAGYLTIAMAMVISNFKDQISKIKNIILTIALISGSIALFLTMSRAAIVIWLVIIGYSLTSLRPRSASWRRGGSNLIFVLRLPRVLQTLAMTIVIIGIILIFIPLSPLRFRFLGSSLFEESVELRIRLIQNSILMIRDHPIFGVGINNFLTILPSYISLKTNAFFQQLQPVHNIYILVLAETGIPGLSFFIWFSIKSFRKNIKYQILNIKYANQKLNSKNLDIKNSFQIKNFKLKILLIVLILGMFDHYFLTLQQGQLLMAFTFGLLWARDRIDL